MADPLHVHGQVDVMFIEPSGPFRRKQCQYTAIDDCTRLRVPRIYCRNHLKTAIMFIDDPTADRAVRHDLAGRPGHDPALYVPYFHGSIGATLPGVEVRVASFDDASVPMPPEATGELMVRVLIVMLGETATTQPRRKRSSRTDGSTRSRT